VNGKLWACGSNDYGELGTGTTVDSDVPVAVDLRTKSVVTDVVAGFQNGGALLGDGTYYDWGNDNNGQVGNGATAPVDVPYKVPLGRPVAQVALGASWTSNGQTIVMLRGGALRAWGSDSNGQLGDGRSGTIEASPIAITSPAGVVYETLASGGSTSYAISSTGVVYAWGDNARGQAGTGSVKSNVLTPTAVDSGASMISATGNNAEVGG
jgi:alpha-tubulin suppressor-like RCC1 family protein